jgi:hypothetical protein
MEQTARHTFDAPIDKVWAMFTDPDAHIAKFEAMGHREIQLVSSDLSDGTFHIEITRLVDVDLPGFARKVLKPTNTVTSRDVWRRADDGAISGEWELETVGAPVKIHGTTALHAVGDQTDYVIDVTLKVGVPLIGGRIENWAKGDMEKQIQLEFGAGDAWLADH